MTTKHSEEYHDAVRYALETAADMIERWEFSGAETEREFNLHRDAAEEVAKRIRRMADRYFRKHLVKA